METLIVHPNSKEQLAALKAVIKALKITFETKKSHYNPHFVAKIKESQQQVKDGKITVIKTKDLWK